MKGRLVTVVGIFCIASLIALDASAGRKPDKPDKPGGSKTEWIVFDGALIGEQSVKGCCPNDGPFPEYEMTVFGSTHDGQLFINRHGAGQDQEYKVQFWNDEIAIEIIGGVIDDDKKNKILTVTFEDEDCVDLYSKAFIAEVSFVLVRTPF